jgi:hypothetical protein
MFMLLVSIAIFVGLLVVLKKSRVGLIVQAPVDAPDGTAARPLEPPSSTTTTSIVGLPRESRISRARMLVIWVMANSRAVSDGDDLERVCAARHADRRSRGDDDYVALLCKTFFDGDLSRVAAHLVNGSYLRHFDRMDTPSQR